MSVSVVERGGGHVKNRKSWRVTIRRRPDPAAVLTRVSIVVCCYSMVTNRPGVAKVNINHHYGEEGKVSSLCNNNQSLIFLKETLVGGSSYRGRETTAFPPMVSVSGM